MKLRVKSTATYVFRCCGVNIIPGVNFIESKLFLQHPTVQAAIQSKMLTVTPIDNDELTKDFGSMNAKALIKEIRQILDINVLMQIKQNETRASVLEILDLQINKITTHKDST